MGFPTSSTTEGKALKYLLNVHFGLSEQRRNSYPDILGEGLLSDHVNQPLFSQAALRMLIPEVTGKRLFSLFMHMNSMHCKLQWKQFLTGSAWKQSVLRRRFFCQVHVLGNICHVAKQLNWIIHSAFAGSWAESIWITNTFNGLHLCLGVCNSWTTGKQVSAPCTPFHVHFPLGEKCLMNAKLFSDQNRARRITEMPTKVW